MTDYEAVVYDLDGTIVHLDVDWRAVAADAQAVYERAGIDPPGESGWELLWGADGADLHDRVEGVIADHEREGARRARRLPLADELVAREVPVGICSLNCEAACRIALDTHGLADQVDVVVGRDSVDGSKPDPEPLLAVVEALSATPEETLFVGDSESDETTAERAGTAFRYVHE